MEEDKGSRGLLLFGEGRNVQKMARRLCLVVLAGLLLSLVGVVAPASAATCVESNCVINVVNERLYAYWGVSNLYYGS